MMRHTLFILFFFFNDTATTEIYTLSLHDALPIYPGPGSRPRCRAATAPSASPAPSGDSPIASAGGPSARSDRKSTSLNSSHANISYAVFCLKKKKKKKINTSHNQKTIYVSNNIHF